MRFPVRCAGLALLAAVLLSCCGTPAPAAEKTVITWWSFPIFIKTRPDEPAGTYEQSVIKAFEAKNPDVKVKFELLDFSSGGERIRLALDDHSVCDVLFDAPGRIIDYGQKGHLLKLNDFFSAAYIGDLRHKSLLGACGSGGAYYMYPLSTAPFYMAFNKERLRDAGVLDKVRDGWTDKDFVAVVRALKAKGYLPGSLFCAGSGGDQATRAFVCSLYGASVTDAGLSRYTINGENGVRALTLIKSCLKEGTILRGTYYSGVDDVNNFVNGLSSFTLLWSPNLQSLNASALKASGVDTVEVPMPSSSGRPLLEYLVNGFCIFDNKNRSKAEAARRFLKFACDDPVWGVQNVVHSGCAPVRNSFGSLYADSESQMVSKWTKYYAPYYNTISGFAEMRPLWLKMLQGLLFGDRTPRQAADDFVRQANKTVRTSR